ncbi:8462_t:CDS:2 [Rhizophagus irregularis]|nr:8462_t:CDS:2 [Rhizophagus irregularis]
MKSMRNLRSKRKINDQQDIEAIIDGFEVNTNSTPNNGKKKWKTTTQKVKSLVTKPTINKTSVGNNLRPSTSNDTTLFDDNLFSIHFKYNTIDTTDNLLKNSSNKIASQVPITIKDESNNISRLPLIDIKNSSQILTNTTNQNSDVIESQMKKLFDLHKQMYDHTIAMFQKQEKTMN